MIPKGGNAENVCIAHNYREIGDDGNTVYDLRPYLSEKLAIALSGLRSTNSTGYLL